jgi:hypothetical protein
MSKRKFWTSSNEARPSILFGGARACRAVGGLLKTEECRKGCYGYTCFKRLLGLETCRAVTQGGPRLGTFVDVPLKALAGQGNSVGGFRAAGPPITSH